jgi:hypothetical protein
MPRFEAYSPIAEARFGERHAAEGASLELRFAGLDGGQALPPVI